MRRKGHRHALAVFSVAASIHTCLDANTCVRTRRAHACTVCTQDHTLAHAHKLYKINVLVLFYLAGIDLTSLLYMCDSPVSVGSKVLRSFREIERLPCWGATRSRRLLLLLLLRGAGCTTVGVDHEW